jgi:hypothetical protein
VPLIDPRTGLIDRSWYMFFLSLFGAAQNTDDPLLAPDTNSLLASYDLALAAVSQEAQTLPVQQQYAPQDVAEPPIAPYIPQDVIEMVRPDLVLPDQDLGPRVELGVLASQNTVDLANQMTGTLPVPNGGTGRATGTTAYALIATGATATGVQQTLANGATTEVLVGGGVSALPVWTTTTGTGAPVRAGSPTITGHPTIEGVTSTGATGTGKFVFGSSPTLVTPLLGTPQSGDFSTGTFTWPTFNQSTTGNAAKLATSPYVYSFSGANVAIGSSVGTFSSTLPAGTSASTNEWLEVIIDTTSYWLPIWVK